MWNFYKHGLTQSSINKFLECKTQFYLEYVEGWQPKQMPMPFNFGHHVHFVLENVYTDYKNPTFQEIEVLLKDYQAQTFSPIHELSPEMVRENQIIYEVARALLKIYFHHYEREFKNNWLHTEKVFHVEFEDTFITGKIDGVYEDENGELWLMDHKCLSYIDEQGLVASLPYDMQVNLYLYAATELFGRFPTGLMYNVIRRPQNKLKDTESAEDYSNRIMFDVLEKPDYYFIRIPLRRDPIELKEWKHTQLSPIVAEIRRWFKNDFEPRPVNPNSLISKYGRCSMFNLITTGSTYGLTRKKSVFPELGV